MANSILIVDDSATMRKIIMRGMRQAGLANTAFTEASDGVEGLKAVTTGTFDLILVDVNMPNMNGLDFVRAVCEKVSAPPPIVMITTDGSADMVEAAISRGAVGYLDKPFTAERIQAAISPFLG